MDDRLKEHLQQLAETTWRILSFLKRKLLSSPGFLNVFRQRSYLAIFLVNATRKLALNSAIKSI